MFTQPPQITLAAVAAGSGVPKICSLSNFIHDPEPSFASPSSYLFWHRPFNNKKEKAVNAIHLFALHIKFEEKTQYVSHVILSKIKISQQQSPVKQNIFFHEQLQLSKSRQFAPIFVRCHHIAGIHLARNKLLASIFKA